MKDLWDSKNTVYVRNTNRSFKSVIAWNRSCKTGGWNAALVEQYFLYGLWARHSIKAQIKITLYCTTVNICSKREFGLFELDLKATFTRKYFFIIIFSQPLCHSKPVLLFFFFCGNRVRIVFHVISIRAGKSPDKNMTA